MPANAMSWYRFDVADRPAIVRSFEDALLACYQRATEALVGLEAINDAELLAMPDGAIEAAIEAQGQLHKALNRLGIYATPEA